jgi:hypothetical protein
LIYQLNNFGLDAVRGSLTLTDPATAATNAFPAGAMYHCRLSFQAVELGDSVQLQVKLRVADLHGVVQEMLNFFVSVNDTSVVESRDIMVIYGGNNQTFELEITDIDGTPGNESKYGFGFHID